MKLLSETIPVSHRALVIVTVTICVTMLVGLSGQAPAQAVDPYQVQVVQTSANLSQALTPLPALEFGSAKLGPEPVINVNAGIRYQSVQGFGAAMTDTSAWLIELGASAAARAALMSELFGPGGIHLNFLRVPMGSTDFTRTGTPYTYDDVPPGQADPGLAHFSIAHDQAYILPALRQVLALNPTTQLLASPWTPPAWMKGNGSLSNAADRGTLRAKAYGPWGEYFVKFLQAYAGAGVPIAAITPQNEPDVPTDYPGLNFAAGSASNWIVQDLEPALARARLHPKLYGNDLGWGPNTKYAASTVFGRAAADLAGISWHCYYGSPAVMGVFHQAAPRLEQILGECSPGGVSPTPVSEIVISSLREWASTVSLWNLALDPKGGPAQLPNHGCAGCVGLARIDPQTGGVTLNRAFYQLGQASQFVAPGARRVATGNFVAYAYAHPGVSVASPGLDDVALRNPDGSIVLVAYNNATVPITFGVRWRARAFSYDLPVGATVTFVFNRA